MEPTVADPNLKVVIASDLRRIESKATLADLFELPNQSELTPGIVLRMYRAMRNITAQELSKCGVGRIQIKLIEKDKHNPQPETIDILSRVFGSKFKEAMLLARKNKSK